MYTDAEPCDTWIMRVVLLEFCYPPGRRHFGGGQEARSFLVTKGLIIHVCGQPRRKHGAVIRIVP